MNQQNKLDQWHSGSEWPLTAVAVVFLTAYSVQVLARPRGLVDTALTSAVIVSYALFVVDYVVRLTLAREHKRWLAGHLFDLAVVILPLLAPLRLTVLAGIAEKALSSAARGRAVVYTGCAAVLLVYAASLAMLQAERASPHASITNFGQAVWWAMTTVTTVGYGNVAPVTVMGRVVAAFLMIGGIGLVGSMTGTLASWIVQRVGEERQAAAARQVDGIAALRHEMQQLVTELRCFRTEAGATNQ
jgi:voltage-gated potassium channel